MQCLSMSTHLSLRRDLLLDHVPRHVGLQQLGLSENTNTRERGVDTSAHVAATRVMWRHVGPSSWVRLQSELLQVLQPQNGDKQPNLDTGDITAKRRWQTPKLYGFKVNEIILQ